VAVPLGVSVTLIGVIGDLLSHTLNPAAHEHEELIVFGSGNNPWHLVLFAGILITAIGGIRWASRLSSEFGPMLGAAMVLLLVATVALGSWSGVQAARESQGETANLASNNSSDSSHAASHGVPADPAAAAIGEGAEGDSHFGAGHGVAGPSTDQELMIMSAQIAAARAATARYRNIEVAKAAGYYQITQFIAGLGLHMDNLKISNDTFDPARPQILLYEPAADGHLVLVGVAYTYAHVNDVPPAGFAGGEDVWHFHTNLCFLPGGSVTVAPGASPCKAQGGFFQKETPWLLHAWIWKTNPDGIFAEYNPRVA
jgi:hypothetical protein